MRSKNYLSVIIWAAAIIAIGALIGACIKPEISTWYSTLHRSPLTPPNYVFPIVWTLLYGILGVCGSMIWRTQSSQQLLTIKIIYCLQLMLNWSWAPLFFQYHTTGLSLLIVCCMDILASILIWLTYPKMRSVALLMTPYAAWIFFASYLNLYIWLYN